MYVENFKRKLVNIDNKKELLQEITDQLAPKEIEKKLLGEVFTPLYLVEEMLDTLNNYGVWSNPDLKWLEPGSGLGNFTICVFYRLMDGLKKVFPDAAERERHIIEKMLYMAELNPANVHICKSIFKANKNGYKLNIYEGDFLKLDTKKEWNVKQFDIIVGNPPYNEGVSQGKTIYHLFVNKCIDKCKYLLFLIPSRWFSSGKGLDDFRKMMLSRKDIRYIKHYDNANILFDNIDLKGGINYFLKDKTYNGLCNFNGKLLDISRYEILIPNHNIYLLIDKLIKLKSITKLYHSSSFLGIETIDYRLHDSLDSPDDIICYVSKMKGYMKYINKNTIKKDYKFWKIITPIAAGKGKDGFGNLIIGNPNQVSNDSYIFLRINSEEEAYSLHSYLKSNLANFMLNLKKITQNISEKTLSWIPLVPLDREWTDLEIYKYFGLTKDEIIEIEKTLGSRARHHSTPEELSMFPTSTPTHNGGYNTVKTIENKKIDKLEYILNNVYKVNISYEKFENKLVELGVITKYIPKLWQKFYINKQ